MKIKMDHIMVMMMTIINRLKDGEMRKLKERKGKERICNSRSRRVVMSETLHFFSSVSGLADVLLLPSFDPRASR